MRGEAFNAKNYWILCDCIVQALVVSRCPCGVRTYTESSAGYARRLYISLYENNV